MARIRAVVRRKYGNSSNKLVIGDLILDTSEKSVTRAGRQIELNRKRIRSSGISHAKQK